MIRSGIITIIGRPNAGKSTLLNTVLGEKLSIVSKKAQTTRHAIAGLLNDRDRGQIVFMDTPGIHQAREGGLNERLVRAAGWAMKSPDILWYLVDSSSKRAHEELIFKHIEAARFTGPVFVLWNKCDLPYFSQNEAVRAEILTGLQATGLSNIETFIISAEKGTGVPELLTRSWDAMPEAAPLYPHAFEHDELSDRPARFFVEEKIRNEIYRCMEDEIPYSCSVEVERFQEAQGSKDLTRIEAVIHVERESQKAIVIGKAGAQVKRIGTLARQEIESFLGKKVFLGLKVKVSPHWSSDEDKLRRLGYGDYQSSGSRS